MEQQAAARDEFQRRAEEWKDVRAYQQQQREQQRLSIAQRLAEASRIKEEELEEHHNHLDTLHMEIEMRRMDLEEQRKFKKVRTFSFPLFGLFFIVYLYTKTTLLLIHLQVVPTHFSLLLSDYYLVC